MTGPDWISLRECHALHAAMLERFGGLEGVRDDGLHESALLRPQNLFSCDDTDLFAMAAAYATGVIKNHPFLDGNKRIGFMTAHIFLGANGLSFQAT
jgi:death-on-curing protein